MSLEIIKKQLKEHTVSGLYYLYGEEQYLIDYYEEQIKKECSSVMPEFNLLEPDGKKIDWYFLTDAITSYPVMAEKKLVVVADADGSAFKGENLRIMTAAVSDMAPGVTLLFVDHAREKGKKSAAEDPVKKLHGTLLKAEKPSGQALLSWLRDGFQARDISISEQDCAYMIELTDSSMLRLSSEQDKLSSCVGSGGTVDRCLIDRMVARTEDTAWFAISGAICGHDFSALSEALHNLYRQNVDDIVIAGMFYRVFVDLWRGVSALSEGISSPELAANYKMNPYAAAKILRNASAMQREEVLYGLRRAAVLDQKIKTGEGNKKDLIYSFVAELLEYEMRGK